MRSGGAASSRASHAGETDNDVVLDLRELDFIDPTGAHVIVRRQPEGSIGAAHRVSLV
jgi:hypothetical protein